MGERKNHLLEFHEKISPIFFCHEKHEGISGIFDSKAKYAEHLSVVHFAQGEKINKKSPGKSDLIEDSKKNNRKSDLIDDSKKNNRKSPGKSDLIDDSSKKLEDVKTFQIVLRPPSWNQPTQADIQMVQIERSRPEMEIMNGENEETVKNSNEIASKSSKNQFFKMNFQKTFKTSCKFSS